MDFRKNLPFESYGVKSRFRALSGSTKGRNYIPEAKLVGQVLLERLATGSHRHKTSEIGCLPMYYMSTHSGYEASYVHA